MARLPTLTLALLLTVSFSACEDREERKRVPEPTETSAVSPAPPKKPRAREGKKPAIVSVALTGDFLIHSNVWAAAAAEKGFDFYRLIRPVAEPLREADLAICHLETPLAPKGGPYESYPLFAAPPALLDGIKRAGYDGCTTASNHTVDQGFTGLGRTLDFMDRAGLRHSGSYRSKSEASASAGAAYYDVKGVKVASLSYTYGTNGMPVEKPWSVNLLDPAAILRDARQARQNGADIVLVGLHWGSEYQTEPTEEQLALADRLTRSPAITLLYGHHAHVVQPVRKINGKWVIFGLGNFLAGQAGYQPGVDDGVIAQVRFVRTARGEVVVKRPRYLHTHIGMDLVVRRIQ